MPLLLIAEDNPAIAKMLYDDLRKEHPGAVIHLAATQTEVQKFLDDRKRDFDSYLIIVFDMKLPVDDADQPTFAFALAKKIVSQPSETVVFFMSAHKDDSIKNFVESIPRPLSARPVFIAKEGEWESNLYFWIRFVIHNTRIYSEFKRVFKQPSDVRREHAGAFRTQRFGRVSGDATQEIGALERDIAEHWDFLDDELKARLQRVFSIRKIGNDYMVSLSSQ